MNPTTLARTSAAISDKHADELRSRMYGDHEFMTNVRKGWEEELRDEGMTVEEYRRSRKLD